MDCNVSNKMYIKIRPFLWLTMVKYNSVDVMRSYNHRAGTIKWTQQEELDASGSECGINNNGIKPFQRNLARN